MAILKTIDLLEETVNNLHLNVAYYEKSDILNVELFRKSPFQVNFYPTSDSVLLTEFEIRFNKKEKPSDFTFYTEDKSFKASGKFGDTIKTPVGKITIQPTGLPFTDNIYGFTLNSVAAVITNIQQNLVISIPDDQTTVIQLDYNTNIPKKGQAVVGQLINEYMERSLNEKNEISDSTISFVNQPYRAGIR
jgi:hypothetical protein